MSESDGMDDLLDGGLRQSLMIASRIAETLARHRQEAQRQQEQQDTQAAHEAQTRLAAERSAAHAALVPVENDQWWDKAQPRDIATAYTVAESWKEHDPTALAASERIREEVLTRYGIDTHDVGPDAEYLESGVHTIATEKARQEALDRSQEQARKAAAEHEKAMQLLAAAQAEELRTQAAKLAPEMERHQVPVEYLANPELAQALQRAHNAKTPKALESADGAIKERLFLIGKDGVNGADIDQLREETTANVNGAGEAHFKRPRLCGGCQEPARGETDAWGNTTTTGPQAGTNPWQYAGGYKDTTTGYTKFGARYYNPTTGRFTQPDPSDQEANRYLYAEADPINRRDTSGLSTEGNIFGEIIGTVVGGAFTFIVTTAAAPLGIWAPVLGGAIGGCVKGAVSGGASAAFDDENYTLGDAGSDCGLESLWGGLAGAGKGAL